MRKNKNNIAKNLTTIQPSKPNEPLQLNAAQADEIAAAERMVVDAKCKLANMVIQQLQMANEVARAEQGLVDKISSFARQFGITPEQARNWKFDTKTMTFSKVG